jgi:2-polyprenyl-3-methyl-5-hydroxy-6-metoxy-1,4-benzoquinol methylase
MKKSEELGRGRWMSDHNQNLARASDLQAPLFERAPVQSDPIALERLVAEAGLPAGCLILDAGCGPGLVSAAFLEAGYRVVGVDLSREMIERARKLCSGCGERGRFLQTSVFDRAIDSLGPFDAALCRYVLHHVAEVRDRLLQGPIIRSFRPQVLENGSIRIDCWRAIVRGLKSESGS